MRARDVRAISFCAGATAVLFGGSLALLHSLVASLALTVACDAWLLTRPRMLRVYRRLRGDPGWSGYFDNEGTRFTPGPAPGRAPSTPHPAERP